MSKPIDRDLAYCLVAALRYQLPRRTYGSGIVAHTIRRYLDRLADETLIVMERDLGEAFRDGATGGDADTREWRELHRHISDALTARTVTHPERCVFTPSDYRP